MSVDGEPALPDGTPLRPMPKVSLHDHLDGGLRPDTVVELAEEIGLVLPAAEPSALGEWFRASADSGSLPDYLKTFDVTLAVMQTAEQLARVAREAVLDLVEDGVVYAELRWAPEQHLSRGLSLDAAVEAVQQGIEEGIALAEAAGEVVWIGQLVTAMRQNHRSREIAELALRHRERGVVGFDIAGPERGFPPSLHREAFELLSEAFFPVTVHAGEADGLASIRSALRDGRALRLGHGVNLALAFAEDATPQDVELANWVLDRGIALELCPSSNLQTGAVAHWGQGIADHPFDLLYTLGYAVTVSPDNRLMSGTDLSTELGRLAAAFDYDVQDIGDLQLNAATAAFLPYDDREELLEHLSDYYEALEADDEEPDAGGQGLPGR